MLEEWQIPTDDLISDFIPKLVMLRAWVFRASGGLGLLCIGPRAGRAFLYRASGLLRAF